MEEKKPLSKMEFVFKMVGSLAEKQVMEKALKAYAENAPKKKKYIAEDLLGIIDYQYKQQYPQG